MQQQWAGRARESEAWGVTMPSRRMCQPAACHHHPCVQISGRHPVWGCAIYRDVAKGSRARQCRMGGDRERRGCSTGPRHQTTWRDPSTAMLGCHQNVVCSDFAVLCLSKARLDAQSLRSFFRNTPREVLCPDIFHQTAGLPAAKRTARRTRRDKIAGGASGQRPVAPGDQSRGGLVASHNMCVSSRTI
jgi:hypothetical protein